MIKIFDFIKNLNLDESSFIFNIGIRSKENVELVREQAPKANIVNKNNIDTFKAFCSKKYVAHVNMVWIEKGFSTILLSQAKNIFRKTEYIYIESAPTEGKKTIHDFMEALSPSWVLRFQDGADVLLENLELKNSYISPTGSWNTKNMNEHVFDQQLATEIISLFREIGINSCIDFGCGSGEYVRTLNQSGINCKGYDGNPFTKELSHDLCDTIELAHDLNIEVVDCILSLEVGEHIPAEYERTFINNLIKHSSNLIILSWAIPEQGGYGHVNCRTNEYIKQILWENGFHAQPELENRLREGATATWFKNTIMVFKKHIS